MNKRYYASHLGNSKKRIADLEDKEQLLRQENARLRDELSSLRHSQMVQTENLAHLSRFRGSMQASNVNPDILEIKLAVSRHVLENNAMGIEQVLDGLLQHAFNKLRTEIYRRRYPSVNESGRFEF